jgi:hypothetical protein
METCGRTRRLLPAVSRLGAAARVTVLAAWRDAAAGGGPAAAMPKEVRTNVVVRRLRIHSHG